MLKVAVKHLIKELAITALFDKMSVNFGNLDNSQVIRSDKIEVKHLGFIKHFYDSHLLWSEGKNTPYHNHSKVHAMLLYSVVEVAYERNVSVDTIKNVHGSFNHFVKIYIIFNDRKTVTSIIPVTKNSWIVK